jgi:glycosyltransferase involved in cell wall biosynthesis
MKILFLSHTANNPNAGASSIYHMLHDGLSARGHRIDVLHLDDMNLPTQRTARRIVSRLFLPQQISRRAAKEDPSQYDVIMASNGMAWPLFRKLKAQARRPLLVSHFHGLTLYDQIAILTEAAVGHLQLSLSARFLTGPILHRWDMAGVANSDLSVVQNIRDLAYVEPRIPGGSAVALIRPAVAPSLISAAATIAPLAIRPVNKIITFSSWGARKGSFYLPDALRRIRTRCPAAELVIGGTNMPAQELQPFFAPEDRGAIHVLGFLSREEQARLYNEAAIFLFPSSSEGFGLALLEAQIFGLAAVTTSTGYGGDFLTDGTDARVVPLTAAHLADAVIALLENDAARQSIAERGRAIALGFTLDAMADAYERAFQTGLEKMQQPSAGNALPKAN